MNSDNNQLRNSIFIKKFKKDNNVKVQTKLPSRVEADNATAVTNGFSVIDATWFRRFMEEAKFHPVTYGSDVIYLFEMAARCGCSPVGLIHFGRTNYGFKQFGHDEVVYLKEHMLADHDDDADVDDKESASYEETEEPYNDNPNSEEAYAIDDDDAAEYAAANHGKRKARCVGEEED